jgi:hypothetical protein
MPLSFNYDFYKYNKLKAGAIKENAVDSSQRHNEKVIS